MAAVAEGGGQRVTLEAEEDTRRHNKLLNFYRAEGYAQVRDSGSR